VSIVPGRTIRVVAAVLERDGRYLITQRRPTAVLPLMWEFPGGKVEPGETDTQALKRELLHRLGAQIECGKLISFVSHPYEHYSVDLFLYECHFVTDKLEAKNVTPSSGSRAASSSSTRSRRPTKPR